MTLPTSGLITLQDIQTEFGGSNPIYLGEYYRGGTYVPVGTSAGTGSFQDAPLTYAAPAQIAASGTIQMSMFRGTSAVVPFVLNDVVSSNTTNYTMRNRAISAGWDAISPLIMTVTINAGITVSATDTINSAFRTKLLGDPAFPVGSSLTLINNGTIAGAGGTGAPGGTVSSETSIGAGVAGNPGGKALVALDPLFVQNNGTIGGGGGGGGGGGALVVITDGKLGISVGYGGGGGGGGRAIGASSNFGPGGGVSGCDTAVPGDSGTSGTLSAAGAGGAGADSASGGSKTAGSGGAGGDLGQPGQPGRSILISGGSLGGAGGAAGPAIDGNANITWGNLGTILGSGWTSPYTLSASVNPVNEGSSVTITLNGTGISGTSVPYTITGISSADIGGASLSGNFVVGTSPTQVLTLAADGLTEGTETLTLALTPPSGQTSSPSVAVNVNDTSFGAGQVLPSASGTWQIENTTVYPTIAQANIHFRAYGDTEYPNGGVLSGSNWFTVTTPGIGSSYWIRFTVNSGTVPQGSAVNTWISLSIAPSWYIQSAMSATQNNASLSLIRQTTFTIEIASNSSGTNIVATHTGNTFYAEQVSSLL